MSRSPASVNALRAAPRVRRRKVHEDTAKKAYVPIHGWREGSADAFALEDLGKSLENAEAKRWSRMKAEQLRDRKAEELRQRLRDGTASDDELAVASGLLDGQCKTDAQLLGEMAAETRRGRDWHVNRRFQRGFEWRGGLVGDNPEYAREPFVYEGLVSHTHPILRLFNQKLPRAKRLFTGSAKGASSTTDSKALALDYAYVDGNKSMVGFLRVDMDARMSAQEIAEACEDQRIPLPNIVVGFEKGGRYINPHLIWLLPESLPFVSKDPDKDITRFRCLHAGVGRGLTLALLRYGADPCGLLNALRVKNPLSPLWDREILSDAPYDLGYIRDRVDITCGCHKLKRLHAELHAHDEPPTLDGINAATISQSNRYYATLTDWAREEVVTHRKAEGTECEFNALVSIEAYRLGAVMAGEDTRTQASIANLAAKVAYWTWNVYRGRKPRRVTKNSDELSACKAKGGKAAAQKRKLATESVIVAAARRLADEFSRQPKQLEVLAAARGPGCTNEKTVRRHWPAVLEALAA